MNTDTMRERVEERATRLYENGYRTARLPDGPDGIFLTIGPGGAAYIVDAVCDTCTCDYFPNNGYCKHALGLAALLKAQIRANKLRRQFVAAAQAGEPATAAASAQAHPALPEPISDSGSEEWLRPQPRRNISQAERARMIAQDY